MEGDLIMYYWTPHTPFSPEMYSSDEDKRLMKCFLKDVRDALDEAIGNDHDLYGYCTAQVLGAALMEGLKGIHEMGMDDGEESALAAAAEEEEEEDEE